jgi:hypothetical protein
MVAMIRKDLKLSLVVGMSVIEQIMMDLYSR